MILLDLHDSKSHEVRGLIRGHVLMATIPGLRHLASLPRGMPAQVGAAIDVIVGMDSDYGHDGLLSHLP